MASLRILLSHACCTILPQEITLKALPEICYPASDPASKLATAKAKQSKEGVRKPFPFADLADFVPSWASVV